MNLLAITNQPLLPPGSEWLVWFLALVALLLFLRYVLARNGKVHLKVNGKEVVELETEGSSVNKSTSKLINEEEKKPERKQPEEDIKNTNPSPPVL